MTMEAAEFARAVVRSGIRLATGVPDSLLKELNLALEDSLGIEGHETSTNEGSAVGVAIGHYLATGSPALVYLQNSGLGNAVNPLASLASPQICGIPMLLVIGWRAEVIEGSGEQLKDEPQHRVQGRMTLGQLDLLGIPFEVIDRNTPDASCVSRAVDLANSLRSPVAIVVRKDTFSGMARRHDSSPMEEETLWSREAAIDAVVQALPSSAKIIATTGMASRELFELRKSRNQSHVHDFLVVGGMGHALAIASGVARINSAPVVCIDGDGAVLMHTGMMALAAQRPNLVHVLLNNGAHDSVGGQNTVARRIDLCAIAHAMGYAQAFRAATALDVRRALDRREEGRASFIEVLCRKGHRSNLGRPDRTPAANRQEFMDHLMEKAHA